MNVPIRRLNLRKSGSRRRSEARQSGRNIKLEIEYDGTRYAGWQIQNHRSGVKSPYHRKTIQGIIEEVLQKILQEKVRLIASGRTDAGVHALGQVANFKTESDLPAGKLQQALNALLPDDIIVSKVEEAGVSFNSRFDAQSKRYRYAILNRAYPSALLRNHVYFCAYPLDLKLMQQEARVLLGRHNFAAFQASGAKKLNMVRTIKKNKIVKHRDLISIDIEADGFLYNMVRNIVGTLIEIGRGKLPKGSMKKILLSKDRKNAGPTAPAQGLFLVGVRYR